MLVLVTAGSTKGLYPTQAVLDEAAAAAEDNPAALAFNGPTVALDTIGGQVAFQLGAFGLAMVGLMSLLLVGRLTRGEEDSGRLELVRAMPVGRHAPLAAGLVVVAGVDVLVGVARDASSSSLQDLPVAGSIVLGASFTAVGLFFAGVAALTAQVTREPAGRVRDRRRGARRVVRWCGRSATPATARCRGSRRSAGRRRPGPTAASVWWPLGSCLVAGGGAGLRGRWLATRRDFGAGLCAPRPGPAHAAPALRGPLGLAVRLQRGAVLWWTVSVLAMAVVYGLPGRQHRRVRGGQRGDPTCSPGRRRAA